MPDGTYAVALHARDERELRELAGALERAGLQRHLVVEADAPYSGQAMALGIVGDRKPLKRFLSRFPLMK